ncbi:hypothetical protein BDV98DRAFT_530794, partial [Pterulicium gracile]
MTKTPSAAFFVSVNVTNPDGSLVYGPDGKVLERNEKMEDTTWNGRPQPLYFPDNYDDSEKVGKFKGIDQLLQERGISTAGKELQCDKKFGACPKGATNCCLRRTLYCQPDFANVESRLSRHARELGVKVMLLPKYHCELNFIEQCWGYAKRLYREKPESPNEEVLIRNVQECMRKVPRESMRRFATRSLRFMDAYRHGLNGEQAAWAAKKYRSRRILPVDIMEAFD